MGANTTKRAINAAGRALRAAGLFSVAAITAGGVHASPDYQESVLLSPGPAQRAAEARGLVVIYDGLENEVVELALDTQFDRIENMMFVRTRYPVSGDEYVEEGDCD